MNDWTKSKVRDSRKYLGYIRRNRECGTTTIELPCKFIGKGHATEDLLRLNMSSVVEQFMEESFVVDGVQQYRFINSKSIT